MVRQIQQDFATTAGETGLAQLDPRIARALESVPRHCFVPPAASQLAYLDRPVAIGCGQTISQPFIVAFMTQLAHIGPESRVLEIGTGSGYQAAVLAELAAKVYSVDIVHALAERASALLARLGCDGVRVRCSDGFEGWPAHAPFDAILVTAAAPAVPPPLLEQLALHGRMVLPIGDPTQIQQLVRIEKRTSSLVESFHELPVKFVPLIRGSGPEKNGH